MSEKSAAGSSLSISIISDFCILCSFPETFIGDSFLASSGFLIVVT